MRVAVLIIGLIAATPLCAQTTVSPRPPAITVTGIGNVETPPDRATLGFSLRGEGATPDAATRALAAKQKTVVAGLRGLDQQAEVRTGSVSIAEVRRGDCDDNDAPGLTGTTVVSMEATADELQASGDPRTPKTGPCRVVGRLAQIEGDVILHSVKDAGTAVGLAGRLGASSARVDSFTLADDRAASARAVAAAIADARAKAQAIATGTGARLGPILSVDDGGAREALARESLNTFDVAPPPQATMMAPVPVEISPKPVETTARLVVSFTLLP